MCTPALERLTIMGAIFGTPGTLPSVTLPRSIKTIALFFRDINLDRWIGSQWALNGASLTSLVATTGGFAYQRFLDLGHVTNVYLRPQPPIQPGQFHKEEIQYQLCGLPDNGSRGTLVYSSFFYLPPPPGSCRIQWVKILFLKTSGFGGGTENERWTALLTHLPFVLEAFPNLKRVYIFGVLAKWRKRSELQEFAASAKGKAIEVYV